MLPANAGEPAKFLIDTLQKLIGFGNNDLWPKVRA